MTAATIAREDGGWRLPLAGRSVSRCVVDHAFSLEFHDGACSTVVRVGGVFTVVEGRQEQRLIASEARSLGPALSLFGQVIRSALVSSEGTLTVEFEDGRRMIVEPDDQYEAWEMLGPGGMRLVCMPGGDVAVWQPKDESSA